jgi:hypothetical protein
MKRRASMRANRSVTLPGDAGAMMVMVFDG